MTHRLLLAAFLFAACAPPAPPPVPAGFVPVPPGPETDAIREAREALLAGAVARIGMTDARVLGILRDTDRRVFLPPELWPRAWADGALRRPDGETAAAVDLSAVILATLEPDARSRVLECGTRSGWLTALLARAAGRVCTVSSRPEIAAGARRSLALLGIDNVAFRTGAPEAGWPEEGPFDAVLVNGRVDHVPRALYASLVPGGRIVAPVGPEDGSQTLVLSVRGEGEPRLTRALLSVRFAPLR